MTVSLNMSSMTNDLVMSLLPLSSILLLLVVDNYISGDQASHLKLLFELLHRSRDARLHLLPELAVVGMDILEDNRQATCCLHS